MASVSVSLKNLAILMVVVLCSSAAVSTVSAQDSGTAPAPAPGIQRGSGYSLPISGAGVCASLILSLLALMKN